MGSSRASVRALAQELGLSRSRLHQLLQVYEAHFPHLLRDPRGRRRLTPEALDLLRRTQALVERRQAGNYADVFRFVRHGGPPPEDWLDRVEVRLARLENCLAALEARLSTLHGEWPAALVLLRKLVRELEGAAREVAEVRLILHDSLEPMARQGYGDLLSTPSLLRGREASSSAFKDASPSPEPPRKKRWWE